MKSIIIVLILCMFVGGASADSITFNPTTLKITVTGFNATHPCTFTDVYNADIAGGWGVIERIADVGYFINLTKFVLGNATQEGHFGDTDKVIVAKVPFPGGYLFDAVAHKGYLYFGSIKNATLQTAHQGCDFTVYTVTPNGRSDFCNNPVELYLYGCKIQGLSSSSSTCRLFLKDTNGSIWQTHFNKGVYFQYHANNLSLYDVTWSNTGVSTFQYSSKIPSKKLQIYNSNYGVALFEHTSYTYDMYARDIGKVCWLMMPTGHHYIIDADVDWNKGMAWWGSGVWGVYRQYTINLQTTPNAEITIMNHTDIVYQDYAYDNGTLDEQILTMGHYTQSRGSTLNSHNPYSIEIKKAGYHTYAQEFTLNEPIKWHILLLPDRVQVGSKIIRPARRS